MSTNFEHFLPYFWAYLIAFSIFVYIIADGYDLGVALLFPFAKTEAERNELIESIAPFWDGNETWLIIVGACLFGAFPAIYSIFLSAFYLPVVLLLIGLIFRGVSFEYREQALKHRGIWEFGFVAGSAIATIVQGAAIGTLIIGIPLDGTTYVGDGWDWLAPFPVLCGIGLCIGYSMLGAGWLILKTTGVVKDRARKQLKFLSIAFSFFVAIAFSLTLDFDSYTWKNWTNGTALIWVAPLLGFISLFSTYYFCNTDNDRAPFFSTVTIFLSAFISLAISFWPYMIPGNLTIEEAAAPNNSLEFMFWGAIFMMPIVIFYYLKIYKIFKGKTGTIGY